MTWQLLHLRRPHLIGEAHALLRVHAVPHTVLQADALAEAVQLARLTLGGVEHLVGHPVEVEVFEQLVVLGLPLRLRLVHGVLGVGVELGVAVARQVVLLGTVALAGVVVVAEAALALALTGLVARLAGLTTLAVALALAPTLAGLAARSGRRRRRRQSADDLPDVLAHGVDGHGRHHRVHRRDVLELLELGVVPHLLQDLEHRVEVTLHVPLALQDRVGLVERLEQALDQLGAARRPRGAHPHGGCRRSSGR